MSLLIKNIQLIDGTGKPAYKADVLVKKKLISAVGNLGNYKTKEVIDGFGAYLFPGFIDIHGFADRYLSIFTNPFQERLLGNGVTTVIGGQDGISLAPIIYGPIDLVPLEEWIDTRKINFNWHSFAEFLNNLRKRPLGVNFGSFVGFETLHHSLTGNASPHFTRNELEVFNLMLKKSLREGAFGLSLGPNYFSDKEPSYYDLKNILHTLSKENSIYFGSLGAKKDENSPAINRLIKLSEETGAKIHVNHLWSVKDSTDDYNKNIELIETHSARADISFEIHPSPSIVFPVYGFLPSWLLEELGVGDWKTDKEKILEIFENGEIRNRLIESFPKIKSSDVRIVSAPGHEYLEGKYLREFSRNRGLSMAAGILKLIQISKGRAIVSRKIESPRNSIELIGLSQSVIASTDGHLLEPEKSFIPQFLEKIRKSEIIPLETAVHKLTGSPARRLGLQSRGLVKVGNAADLVIFKNGETREVIVNGQRVLIDGKCQNIAAGEIIKSR